MRGVKFSSGIMLIALLIACLISVPAFSGEHPWDSDGNKNGSNGGSGSGSGDPGTEDPIVLKTSASGGSTPLYSANSQWSLLFKVSYSAVEKLYAKMYDAGAKTTKSSRSVGR